MCYLLCSSKHLIYIYLYKVIIKLMKHFYTEIFLKIFLLFLILKLYIFSKIFLNNLMLEYTYVS